MIEDVYAQSLERNPLLPWPEIRPRSLSVLPIADACQAKCKFCFSHSSVSDDQRQGKILLSKLDAYCQKSVDAGAERFVITGGGEPTLMKHERLLDVISLARQYFPTVTLITNGYSLGHNPFRADVLRDYETAGLTVLSISRHSPDNNQAIMKVDTKSELVAETWKNGRYSLHLRWVCVLQQQGVHDVTSLRNYLDWTVETGVRQICFKELYVATSAESQYHSSQYNDWCRENQVSMKFLPTFLEQNGGTSSAQLPWGAPVYKLNWRGHDLLIAVYTEPSVFWERTRGIARSWNLMANGTCYANLETKDSEIHL